MFNSTRRKSKINHSTKPEQNQFINRDFWQSKIFEQNRDEQALIQLTPLIKDHYTPFTISSLRPFAINMILTDILINGRKRIIEFGSGISTLLMKRMIEKEIPENDIFIYSVDHDAKWLQKITETLGNEGLLRNIELISAPLVQSSFSENEELWYNTSVINKVIGEDILFDMVIIDGPPAWEKGKELARFPALPYILEKLDENVMIFLDDVNRFGEKQIIEKWEDLYGISFDNNFNTFAFASLGRGFNIYPI